MSVQLRDTITDAWIATSFYGGDRRGPCIDFGADPARFADVVRDASERADQPFAVDAYGTVFTGDEFMELVKTRWCTYGELGGSMELGSGDLATFEGIR